MSASEILTREGQVLGPVFVKPGTSHIQDVLTRRQPRELVAAGLVVRDLRFFACIRDDERSLFG